MGPFLTFLVSELQRGYLYQNGVEYHQKVIGKNGTMSDSEAI